MVNQLCRNNNGEKKTKIIMRRERKKFLQILRHYK